MKDAKSQPPGAYLLVRKANSNITYVLQRKIKQREVLDSSEVG